MNIDDTLKSYGISLRPDFTKEKQREGSQFMFCKRFVIGERTIDWVFFGDFATGVSQHLESEELTASERTEMDRQLKDTREKFSAEKLENQKRVAEEAKAFLRGDEVTDRGSTPYLDRKKISLAPGSFIWQTEQGKSVVIVPMEDIEGEVWNYQRIYPEKMSAGDKFFLPGGRVSGLFFKFEAGHGNRAETVYVAEGYATACSIWLAFAKMSPVYAAFNAGNLKSVTESVGKLYPHAQIVICADNDCYPRADGNVYNVGVEKSKGAASTVGGTCVWPQFGDTKGEKLTDWNDKWVLLNQDKEALRAEIENFKEQTHENSESLVQEKEDGSIKKEKALWKVLEEFDKTHIYKMMGASKICMVWNGTHYSELEDPYIRNFVHTRLRPTPMKKTRDEFLDRVRITNLTEPDWFDRTIQRRINFKNGVLDIDTGKMSPHSYSSGFRYCLPYNYEPEAQCKSFDSMMVKVTCGSKDLENLLDEFMGYALSFDRYWCHKALVLTGDGENGKSTWLDILKALAGEGNYGSLFLKAMSQEGNLQMLDGKLFNISPEVPKKGAFDTSLFKALTGNDEVTVRKIYKAPYTMRNRAKLIFACNDLPDSNDATVGYFRRWIIVPFNAVFKNTDADFDAHIFEKLLGELPGIFNRALAGYQRLVTQKRFSEAVSATKALDSYKSDIDFTGSWMRERLSWEPIGPQKIGMPVAEIYKVYAEEMRMGEIRPLTKIDFCRKLSRIIPEYEARATRVWTEGKAIRILDGVKLDSKFHH